MSSPQVQVFCNSCGNPVDAIAAYCVRCGAAQQAQSQIAGAPPAMGAQSPWANPQFVYEPAFNLAAVPSEQQAAFRTHRLDSTFPVAVAVLLHFLTFGLFTLIYHGLKHSRLPPIRMDDFRGGKAIGFMFIPFFNLYWLFVFWLRLTDRLNFQFRLRGLPWPVPRGLVLTACILQVIPYFGAISWLILIPIVSGYIQSAANQLVIMGALEQTSPWDLTGSRYGAGHSPR